jgi:hypothetical protein
MIGQEVASFSQKAIGKYSPLIELALPITIL